MRRRPVRVRQFVDLADVLGAAGDEAREAAGGDGAGVGAELGDHAFQDSIDEADVAVVEADLQVVDGVGADDLGGLADVNAGQAGGAVEEGVGGDAEAGGDGSAEVLAARGDAVEGGGGAEVDDQDWWVGRRPLPSAGSLKNSWAATQLTMRSAPTSAGLSVRMGRPVRDAGLDEERLDVEVELGDAAQDGIERRDDGGDGDAGDGGHIQRAQGEEVVEEHAELVDGYVAVGGDAPVGEQGGGGGRRGLRVGEAIEAEDRVGVADVDG